MSGINGGSDLSPSAVQYPALAQMGLVPPPGADAAYENLPTEVLTSGTAKFDRTDTGTHSPFVHQLRYDLRRDFPCITTRSVVMKAVKGEPLWLLHGETNVHWPQERGVTIRDEWADDSGELGPVYGSQWRFWPTRDGGAIDQITGLIDTLHTDPDSRRMPVSVWNASELGSMALALCHAFFQRCVAGGCLSPQIYQCSVGLSLGVPFNIASYALLVHILAQQTDLGPGEPVWTGGDCHIYNNHTEQVRTQFFRVPSAHPFPMLHLEQAESIDSYDMDDIDASQGYEHHPTIKTPVVV